MGTNYTTETGVGKSLTVTGPNAGPVLMVATPATSTSPGVVGHVAQDGSFLYVCIADDSWKRIALSAF